MRKTKYLAVICAVIMLITALSVSAYAASGVTDQMAANSAAWWVAYNAGDTATCAALHEANVSLASQAAGGGGSATYSSSGDWSITTSSGSNITTSGSTNGESNIVTYTTTNSSGESTQTSNSTYTDSSIAAYKENGGTNAGLQASYNNAGTRISSTEEYGDEVSTKTAASEAAVAKVLLGLTDAQAKKLQTELEQSKDTYVNALTRYEDALKAGDTTTAAAAKAEMDVAHDKAQSTRALYGYSGDSSEYDDGGYYYGNGYGDGGGFYMSDIVPTYNITVTNGAGGTVSPSGTIAVKKNASQTFTMTANEGFEIANVVVDGSSKGKLSTYTFSNVTAAHTISVTFKANGRIDIGGADIADSRGADLSDGSIKSGYGFFADVTGSHSGVTNAKITMTYNFGKGSKTVTLQETSTGVFEFPKSADSPTNKRCVYIPVETKDGSYTLTLTFTAKDAAGTVLKETKTVTLNVRGTMYEDDFTGDS